MSRTSDANYLRWRRRLLSEAQAHGITNCPWCGVTMDYAHSKQPNSAEPDHIVAWQRGGQNTIDNGQVICRRCNQSKGKRTAPKSHHKPSLVNRPRPSIEW